MLRLNRWAAFFIALLIVLFLATQANAHWPVASRASWISQSYREHRTAIDIASPCGVRILAAKAGWVTWSGWRDNGGGYQVWVRTPRSGKDLYSLYAHMVKMPPVHRGQWVSRQQLIGWIGSTGWSSGCHLHLEMWRGPFWQAGSWRVNPWSRIDHGYWFPH